MRLGNATTPLSGSVTAGNSIYTTSWNGSDTITVKTFVNRTVTKPRWSPDGRRIAFLDYSLLSGNMLALYVMDADGQNERHVGWSLPNANGLDWYDDSVHLLCVQDGTYPRVINVDTLSVPWSGRNPNSDELNLPVGASLGGVAPNAQWFNPLPVNPAAPPLSGLHFIYNEMSTTVSGAPNGTKNFLSMNTQAGVSLPGTPNPTTLMIPYDGGVHSGTQLVGSLVAVAPNRDGFVYFLWHVPDNTDFLYYPTGTLMWQPNSGSAVALYAVASMGLMFSPDQSLVALGAGVGSSVYNWQDFLLNGAAAVRLGGFPTATSSGPGHWHLAAA